MRDPSVFQKHRIGEHARHLIDDATDIGELSVSVAVALGLYGDRCRIDHIAVDAFQPRERRKKLLALTGYACMVLAELPPERQKAIWALGYGQIYSCIFKYARTLAEWAFVDERVGGDMMPFKKVCLIKRDGRPSPRAERRLYSPKFIRRYVKRSDIQWLKDTRAVVYEGSTGVKVPFTEKCQFELMADMERQHEHFAAIDRKKLVNRETRKAVVRAARFAEGVVGPEKVAAFVKGQPVYLYGPDYGVKVRPSSTIFAVGHGALDVSLCDLSGVEVASLCTYQKDTPAIDQLASLGLELLSGSDILANANVIRVTEAGVTSPLLQRNRRHAAQATAITGNVRVTDARRHPHWLPRERALSDEYWSKTQTIWKEATGVTVVGSKTWKPMQSIFAGQKIDV